MDSSIKQALQQGVKPADLIAELQTQIAEAQKDIQRENLAKKSAEINRKVLESTRNAAFDAVLKYIAALGLVKEDEITPELRKNMLNALVLLEESLKN